jgi:hypothetical protein
MAQIYPRRAGPDLVMAAAGGIELHGGGVLELIATLWRPNGQPAQLDDAFPFARSNRAVALREIYDSLRMQIFLPELGLEATNRETLLPRAGLPRTRMQHANSGMRETVELDAYNALALLLRYERDVDATWTNRMGQRISTASLLDSTWNNYVVPRRADEEFSDHSYLHLVEVLLAYCERSAANAPRDPNELKRRLLSVELKRKTFGGYEASEALSHYVDSLGFLVADPNVTWTKPEKTQVRAWLGDLETSRQIRINTAPMQHLAHLLRGLERIVAHAERLQ